MQADCGHQTRGLIGVLIVRKFSTFWPKIFDPRLSSPRHFIFVVPLDNPQLIFAQTENGASWSSEILGDGKSSVTWPNNTTTI